MRILERIAREGYRLGEFEGERETAWFNFWFPQAVPIDAGCIDSLMDRLYAKGTNDPAPFGADNPDVEIVRTPYPTIWLEYEVSGFHWAALVTTAPVTGGEISEDRMGVHIDSDQLSKVDEFEVTVRLIPDSNPVMLYYAMFAWRYSAKTGNLVPYAVNGKEVLGVVHLIPPQLQKYLGKISGYGVAHGYAIQAVMNLLSCSNVQLEKRTRDPATQKRLIRRNEGFEGKVEYHHVKIKVGGKAYRLDTPRGGQGSQGVIPFHRVRGHYSFYGPDYGRGLLFGKYAGKVYVPHHARGNRKMGTIEKTYEIQDGTNSPTNGRGNEGDGKPNPGTMPPV